VLVVQIHGSEMDRRENVSISIDRSIALQVFGTISKVFWIIMVWRRAIRDVPQHVYYAAVHGGKRTITPLPNVQIQRET
jgi:hypothetical protein